MLQNKKFSNDAEISGNTHAAAVLSCYGSKGCTVVHMQCRYETLMFYYSRLFVVCSLLRGTKFDQQEEWVLNMVILHLFISITALLYSCILTVSAAVELPLRPYWPKLNTHLQLVHLPDTFSDFTFPHWFHWSLSLQSGATPVAPMIYEKELSVMHKWHPSSENLLALC